MPSLLTDRPTWRQTANELGATWLKWFGYWTLVDLALHLMDQRLGWSLFGPPRTPGEALFFDSWMASWFMLFSSARSGKLRLALTNLRFWKKQNAQ